MLSSSTWACQGFSILSTHLVRSEPTLSRRTLISGFTPYHHGRAIYMGLPCTLYRTSATVTKIRSARARGRKKRLRNLEDPNEYNHLIDTTSLERTLSNHRKENANKIIVRRVESTLKTTGKPAKVSRPPRKNDQDHSTRHLNLVRSNKKSYGKDYTGVAHKLSTYWHSMDNGPLNSMSPWLAHTTPTAEDRVSALERLGKEIQAANTYFKPTQREERAARRAIGEVTRCICDSPPSTVQGTILKTDVIGSRASGFAHATSDIDLNLVTGTAEEDGQYPAFVQRLLSTIYGWWKYSDESVLQRSCVKPIKIIGRARVPILVCLHTKTGLDVQIQCATTAYGSLGYMKLAQAEYPTVLPLFQVIKQMLNMRELCEGSEGGITSYPVFNMLLTSLKLHPTHLGSQHLGQQLIDFLEFWSSIDTYKVGITHIPSKHLLERMESSSDTPLKGKKLYSHPDFVASVTQDPVGAVPVKFSPATSLGDFYKPRDDFHLVLHDPANPYNNLGRSAYRIKDIQATLFTILQGLKKCIAEWDLALQSNEALSPRNCLLAPLIAGDYTNYIMERKKLSDGFGR